MEATQIAEPSCSHIKPATMKFDEGMKPVRVQSVGLLKVMLSRLKTADNMLRVMQANKIK